MAHRLRALAAAACLAMAWTAGAAPVEPLKEAQKLYGQGRHAQAMEKVDAILAANPRDAGARFLRGVLLTEQKKSDEAIAVFRALTEDFPELPEPYNNLAVLYAAQGEYEKAKSVLDLAILTHPGYALAHENLGDVHARLAAKAYARALELDKANESARRKRERTEQVLAPK
jgi:Flp pilus assembly protein TadD